MFVQLFSYFAAACNPNQLFLGVFPVWYKYLETENPVINGITSCKIIINFSENPNQFWLIGLGIVDILLRVAGLAAVAFVMYGGFMYMTSQGRPTSQGEPDKTAKAKNTILNSLIGLTIAIMAAVIVRFLARSLQK